MSSYAVTRKTFTERIMQREDNHFYRYEMVMDIINMYNEEMRNALLDGENVNINGIGTIVTDIRYRETNFIPPYVEDDYVTLPYVDIRFNKSLKLKDAANRKLRKNLKEKGKLELSEGKPELSDEMKEWEKNYGETHK